MTTPHTEIPTLTIEMIIGLTEAEIKTLLVILRHTEGEGKETVTLTYAQISYGTHGSDGRLLVRGSGLCNKSIGRAVKLLTDKSYIVLEETGRRGGKSVTNKEIWTGRPMTYRLGYRMRPLREWAGDPVVATSPEPIPFRPRRLKAQLDRQAEGGTG